MKQKKNARPIGLGSGLSSLLGAEIEKKTDNFRKNIINFAHIFNLNAKKLQRLIKLMDNKNSFLKLYNLYYILVSIKFNFIIYLNQ